MFHLSYPSIACKSRQEQSIPCVNAPNAIYQQIDNQHHTTLRKKGSTISVIASYLFHDYLLPKMQNGPTFLSKTSGGIHITIMHQYRYVPIVRIAAQSQ